MHFHYDFGKQDNTAINEITWFFNIAPVKFENKV